MKWALSIPLLDSSLWSVQQKADRCIRRTFQRNYHWRRRYDPEVEEFFHKIKFPFTIGYGMTECGPLISYAPWNEFIPTSSGKILDIMEARIYKENPEAETGEIQVRGENVMTGYTKIRMLPRKYSPKTAGCAQVTWEPWMPMAISSFADD